MELTVAEVMEAVLEEMVPDMVTDPVKVGSLTEPVQGVEKEQVEEPEVDAKLVSPVTV